MWVYQQPPEQAAALPPARRAAPAQPAREAPPQPQQPKAQPEAKQAAQPARPAAPAARPQRRGLPPGCAALAGAYLFGSLLAGVALALCRAGELAAVDAYLAQWAGLFTMDEPGDAWALFGTEYLTAALGAAALLLCGLSAFGPVLIYLFTMLYGLGVGVTGLQLFLSGGWRQALLGLLLSGLPAAAAVTGLCLFGASALRVSAQLQRAAFGRREPAAAPAGARRLLAQYLLLNAAFLPICGASTALAALAGQLA